MIKKSDLRSEFERIVKTQKKAVFVDGKIGVLPILRMVPFDTWSLDIIPFGSSWKILLQAVRGNEKSCCAMSYPFRSYKSAYQTLVRL